MVIFLWICFSAFLRVVFFSSSHTPHLLPKCYMSVLITNKIAINNESKLSMLKFRHVYSKVLILIRRYDKNMSQFYFYFVLSLLSWKICFICNWLIELNLNRKDVLWIWARKKFLPKIWLVTRWSLHIVSSVSIWGKVGFFIHELWIRLIKTIHCQSLPAQRRCGGTTQRTNHLHLTFV